MCSTILGYSLYDTVVVFDKVKENTRGVQATSRMTYSEAANLAVNQTLVRSINTSVVGLLPVASLLFVGAYVLGAGTLKDLALALFVGIAVGTYSSIFIATPVLAQLKEREPAMQALAKRVNARRAGGREGVKVPSGAGDDGGDGAEGSVRQRRRRCVELSDTWAAQPADDGSPRASADASARGSLPGRRGRLSTARPVD